VARRLEELARRTARVLRIHVFQASVSGEEWVRSGAGRERLDRAQVRSLSEHTEFRACLVGLPGWDLTLGSVAGRRYVADLDHVSGGTAERMIEVGLPVVGSAVSGLLLTARADLVPGARWVELRVQGENGSPAIFEREGRARSAQALEPHDGLPSGVGDDGATSRDGWLTIDLPEQDTRRWEHVVTAELGKPVLLGASPDATRPGRTVILVATVELFPFLAGQ
jgi:hypothetical protein